MRVLSVNQNYRSQNKSVFCGKGAEDVKKAYSAAVAMGIPAEKALDNLRAHIGTLPASEEKIDMRQGISDIYGIEIKKTKDEIITIIDEVATSLGIDPKEVHRLARRMEKK